VTAQTLAQASNAAVYGAMVVLALAMVSFAADLAFGTGRERARAAQAEARRAGSAAQGGGVAVLERPTAEAWSGSRWGRVGISLSVLAWLLLTASLLLRGLAAGRPPWGNMYEFVLTGSWWVLAVWGFLLARGRKVAYLGVVVTGAVLVALGVAVMSFYVPAADLVPALKDTWLWIHVSAATFASGVFTVGTAATVLYLVRDRYERRLAAGATGGRLEWLARLLHLDGLGQRLPDSDTLDRTAYRAYAFAFPLWFFVLVSGAIWAEDAWGRYWGWDPKETWSFVTLVIFAAYLHARATAGWRGRSAALIALVGYVAFLFNFVGVNIFFSGLHSYAGV
jgi:cytochrome c-type biogenesis protein CcsB